MVLTVAPKRTYFHGGDDLQVGRMEVIVVVMEVAMEVVVVAAVVEAVAEAVVVTSWLLNFHMLHTMNFVTKSKNWL